jgi:hypothetical protein
LSDNDLVRTVKWAQKPIDAELLSSFAEKLEKIARLRAATASHSALPVSEKIGAIR